MNKNHKRIMEYIAKNIDLSNKDIVKVDEKDIIIIDRNIILYFTIIKNKVVFLNLLKIKSFL
ncbi:Uncharacterised protein [[Clostridium] sordellii]|nr:hypothetical protein CP118TE_03740 [Clostridium perfringens E]CEO36658.1 Uncharacterised protein [[Clostridium] sordellii] [Paeniclostridium sordellii]VTQ56200.1 Uncharacterised protein [Clostridium perfringens]